MYRQKSPAIVFRNALAIITMDDSGTEWAGADLLIVGNRIEAVGPSLTVPEGTHIIDASNLVILPGLINTHHHLCQTLTRAVPLVQNAELFDWLTNLYEIWRGFTPELAELAALVGLGELLLTGCTLTTDHTYLFPRNADGRIIDAQINAAKRLGIRFHPTRGAMSLGRSQGGLPPDDVCQDHETIMADCRRLIEQFHDPAPDAMVKLGLAPCAPFNVEERTMIEMGALAREAGLRLHTHMCETLDEEKWCAQKYGMRPLQWAESIGWLGPDVWLAHMVHLNDDEIRRLADSGTGVAHCPSSNMRLGSGIPRVVDMLAAGVPVGLGVDGSSSNDTGDLLGEMRQCLLLQRVARGAAAITPREVLRMATRGGARVLGHDLCGQIAPGKLADVIAVRMDRIGHAGALHDPAGALLLTGDTHIVEYNIVNGRIVVENGQLTRVQESEIISQANAAAEMLVKKAHASTGMDFLHVPGIRRCC
jgi:cytosine/adenosine deaminase-related metal-dependent hydrolase